MLVIPSIRHNFLKDMKKMSRMTFLLIFTLCIIYYLAEISFFMAISTGYVTLVSAVMALEPFTTFIYTFVISIFVTYILIENLKKQAIIIKLVSIFLTFVGSYLLISL